MISPVPEPVYFRPMLHDHRRGSSVKLLKHVSAADPIVVLELGALNVYMIPMSLHIPSFPGASIGLVVDCRTIVSRSDISVVVDGLESPCAVHLLIPNEQLLVCW